ncbi:uncharacterized protein LOC128167052 [Crassostrea angulata]|uniref:uncharacterized protein LOC128167052 n=1 Tax=Magallana angulata TaxID=2784310 RepID=UPI0022B0B7CF|nr:uncharacterized protein LOC128167052 [Crassostrea angulata]
MALCKQCGIEKLSNEFPSVTVSDECDHPPLECLRCVINSCQKEKKCPHPGCSVSVTPDCSTIQWFKAILNEMFREYEAVYTPPAPKGSGKEILNITVLNGDATQIPYYSFMTLVDLQKHIYSKLKIPPNKQKILFEDKEVQMFGSNGQPSTLSDNNIPPYATLYLVVLLYAIPEAFDHVVFDLYWGYPFSGRDYLDASCLLYQGTQFLNLADYENRYRNGISHSGDVMDNRKRIGHHTIHVYLKQIPSNVTHLFFTLSAWSSPNIARYPNPSLKFYEASNREKDLCKTTFTHARNSQAVVMCSVSKNSQGRWEIYESGKLSAGNASNYGPLKSTISNLIKTGY